MVTAIAITLVEAFRRAGAGEFDLVQLASGEVADVHVAFSIFTEGSDGLRTRDCEHVGDVGRRDAAHAILLERPNATEEVRAEVDALDAGERAAVGIATDGRCAGSVGVSEDRVGQGRACAGAEGTRAEAVVTFLTSPAPVLSADSAFVEVEFLDSVLTDVADPHVAVLAIEAEAPRVAKADHPQLGEATEGRLSRRDCVVAQCVSREVITVDVDAKHLAEQHVRVLRAVARVPCSAAVAGCDVQVTVGAEVDRATVVVRSRLAEREDDVARGVRDVVRQRRAGDGVLRDAVRVADRVVHEELAVGREVRVEREAQKAALAARSDSGDRDERRRKQDSVLDDLDAAGVLLDHEDAVEVARRRHGEYR